MPPRLLPNLLKVLSNLSPNIRKIGNSPYLPPGRHGASFSCSKIAFAHVRVTSSSANLHMKHTNKKAKNGRFRIYGELAIFQFSDPRISALLSDIKPNKVASFSP